MTRSLGGLSRWDVGALIGGVVSAWAWHHWSTMDKGAPQDGFTHLYILGFTATVVFLRKQIDLLLAPIQAIKKHIPRLVLIGVALALPYFLAHYFYRQNISNYPLMHKSIVWGTILPYILLRIPENWQKGTRRVLAQTTGPHLWTFLFFGIALYLGGVGALLADDFTRDMTRLEDGLRTGGWAQTIAGTAATAINVLVNGTLVFQKPSQPPPPQEPGEQQEEPAQYTMDIRTEDQRTSIVADGEDRLWLYAKILCNKPEVDVQGLTNAISFTFEGSKYADWMSIKSTQAHSGYKAVLLVCTPPSPEAEVENGATVTVTVAGSTADGEPMQGPVHIEIKPDLDLNFQILS